MKYIMNTTIVTNDGNYSLVTISEEEARNWASSSDFTSAVGHPGTAEVMSTLLGTEVVPNRVMVEFETGDEALVFKLNCRLPEGKVLSADELRDLPYKWKILKRIG